MREEWDETKDNEYAVSIGLAKTGRIVTAAGLIMFAAFMGFVAGSIVGLQQFGFGLAIAILIDVTIVRALLVPSAMALFGRWNWWLPAGSRGCSASSRRRSRTKSAPVRPRPGDRLVSVQIEVVEGDITALEVDAIANAANDRLWMGAGVAGAIKRAGGEEIERQAVALGPIALGDAVATGGGPPPGEARDPRRRDGPGPGHERRARRKATTQRARGGGRAGRRSRSRCPRSAPASAVSRSRRRRGSWSPRRGRFEPKSLERVVFAVFGAQAAAVFSGALDRIDSAA